MIKVYKNLNYKIASGLAIFTGLFLMWVNLAVGIIGSEDHPANLFFFGVVLLCLFNVVTFGRQPLQMTRTFIVTALAQFLAPFLAMIIYQPRFDTGLIKILIFNLFFVAAWLLSAWLFYKSFKK